MWSILKKIGTDQRLHTVFIINKTGKPHLVREQKERRADTESNLQELGEMDGHSNWETPGAWTDCPKRLDVDYYRSKSAVVCVLSMKPPIEKL